ncbi:MAG: TlpA family protein disulfide reductase [Janthinobacterium lividum]
MIARSATVHITIKNFKGSITIYDPKLRYDLTKKKVVNVVLDAHQTASYTTDINQPNYLIIYFTSDKFFNYSLFLLPGDELYLTADFSKKDKQIIVTGKGSNNNQPEIFALTNMDTQPFKGDKTPDRVIAAINKQYLLNKSILTNYIKVNKPSAAFIKNATLNLKYFVPKMYYEFSHNNNFFKPKETLQPWIRIQDSVFATVKLSNSDALNIYNYDMLIDNFLLREAEALKIAYEDQPLSTNDTWLHLNIEHNKKPDQLGQPGSFDKVVLKRYFSGKAAQFAYGEALKWKFARADYPAIVSIFNQLKQEYPASAYVKAFAAPVAVISKKQRNVLSSKTVFVKNNGTQLNTFNDLLALTKGKTALLDMWGTWCSPCRKEIEQNAAKLEAHFKGKNVNFIYIANDDVGQEQTWKKAIAYFQIEGIQILANSMLTTDIMNKVKSTGYPTYILIKKDGSYKKTTTQLPVNLQAMIKEIEVAEL